MCAVIARVLRRVFAGVAALVLGAALVTLAGAPAAAAPPPPSGNVTIDPAFTGGVSYMVWAMAQQSDGKVVTWGLDRESLQPALSRVTSAGALDPTFQVPTLTDARFDVNLTAQPDDKLLISGDFTAVNGVPRAGLARLNANGTLDTGFVPTNPAGKTFTGKGPVALQPNGAVLLTGTLASGGTTGTVVARFSSTGTFDPSLNVLLGDGTGLSATIVVQPDGKLLLGGTFTKVNGVGRNGIARVSSTGVVDPTFDPGVGFGAYDQCPGCGPLRPGRGVKALALQPDGKVVVGGSFVVFNWFPANQLIRLNADGSRDISFDTGSGVLRRSSGAPQAAGGPVPLTISYQETINALALQPDGRVIIGGLFESYRGTQRAGIARVNTNGSVDLGFDPGAGFYGSMPVDQSRGGVVFELALVGGQVLAGGSFTAYDQQPVANLTRLVVGAAPPVTMFTPLAAPVRVFDSRTGAGTPVTWPRSIDMTGGGAVSLPASATAVAVNLTVTGQTSSGYATLTRDNGRGDPSGCPSSSMINWSGPSQTTANATTTGISAAKKAQVCVNGQGSAHVVVDVMGYYSAPSGALFVPTEPTRSYDSRADGGPLAGGSHRNVDLGAAPVPAGATAIAYNLTITGTAGTGYLAVAPSGTGTLPAISTINWTGAGQTIANAAQTGVTDHSVKVFAGGSGSTEFILDVVGYFAPAAALPPGATGLAYQPIPQTRAYDSRTKDGALAGNPLTGAPGEGRTTSISLGGALPAATRGVTANFTITGNTGTGFLTAGGGPSTVPGTSLANWTQPNTTFANATALGTSPTGEVTTWVGGRYASQYLIDISGYYTPVG